MNRTIKASFRIFLSDNFERAVKDYFKDYNPEPLEDELQEPPTIEEVRQYLEDNMILARSKVDSFEIEGGDTDGWFIDNLEID